MAGAVQLGDDVVQQGADDRDRVPDAAARARRGEDEGGRGADDDPGHFPGHQRGRDVFGVAAHTANRMTSQAKAGQIIITDAIQQRLSEAWKAVARRVDVAVPRGQHEEVTIFEVLWQHGETTSMLPAIATITEAQKQFRIRLRYLGTELVLDPRERSAATLGRGQENDLVIKGNLVSRLHARIEAGKNRFILVDQSTNGSFVQTRNGDDAFVRRDAIPLKGQGVIGLGRVPEPQSYHTVEFICEDGPDLTRP